MCSIKWVHKIFNGTNLMKIICHSQKAFQTSLPLALLMPSIGLSAISKKFEKINLLIKEKNSHSIEFSQIQKYHFLQFLLEKE